METGDKLVRCRVCNGSRFVLLSYVPEVKKGWFSKGSPEKLTAFCITCRARQEWPVGSVRIKENND